LQYIAVTGLAAGASLPVHAAEINPNKGSAGTERMAVAKDVTAAAQREDRRELRDKWQKLSPEERMQRRKAMRENWEKMSPAERQQLRDRLKDRWKNMSQEEREQRRNEMRERFKNMPPKERRQFERDMSDGDGMPPPDGNLPRGKSDNAGNTVQR
jgi:membrane protein involved in colicin uptake